MSLSRSCLSRSRDRSTTSRTTWTTFSDTVGASTVRVPLSEAIGLSANTRINPSGGALAANPMFAAGLERIGSAAQAIMSGTANRTLAHATSGPALQQNLVAVMEVK